MHMLDVSSVQPIAMCSAVFCIVYSFVMFVVNTLGDHIMEAYYSIDLIVALYIRVMSPFGRKESFWMLCLLD